MTGRHSEESKKNFELMRQTILTQQGQNYWRSLEEFVDAPEFEEFVSREFPQHAEEWNDPVSRRSFLKVMGASLALAGLSSACVIQPPEKIIPYVRQPEEIVPGKVLFYATSMNLNGVGVGLLAKSNEGRPTKIEGNPEHPGSRGATDRFAQASLLNMYDPDRSREYIYRNTPRSWDKFVSDIRSVIEDNRKNGGAGIRFLTETITSPTLIGQFRQILSELPNARWYQYEPCNNDNGLSGAKMAFGENVNTVYRFDQADRILSLDSDFLSSFNVRYPMDFSDRRRVTNEKKDMNRLYVAETTPTITGAKADHRLSIKPSQMEGFVRAVAGAVGVSGATSTYTDNGWAAAMAKDLQDNGRGKSIVIAGDHQPPVIHALAHAMNAALGNVGKTVIYTEPLAADTAGPNARTQVDGLRELVGDIDAGAVQLLMVLGGNPVYNAPADLKFDMERLSKVPLRVHLSQYNDETSEICHWHIPQTHYLEEWSDTRAYDGTATLIQPLIAPLYEGKSVHEVLNVFANENYDRNGFDIIKEFWQRQGLGGALRPLVATTTGANTGAVRAASSTNNNGQTQSNNSQNQSAGNNVANNSSTGINNSSNSNTAGINSSNNGSSNTANTSGSNNGSNNAPNTGSQSNLTTQRESVPLMNPAGQGPDSVIATKEKNNVPKSSAADTSMGGTSSSASTTVSAPSSNFDSALRKAIHDGFIANTAAPTRNVTARTDFLGQTANIPAAGNNQLEVVILPDHSVYDGRFANNGWLQELPKPLNKITWDNVLLLSPRTAEKYGLNLGRTKYDGDAGGAEGTAFVGTKGGNLNADLVQLRINGQQTSKALPVWVTPGQPDDVATIYLGFGRKNAGRVGNNVGYNAYEVRTANVMSFAVGEISKTGEQAQIASTQTHFNMEGRDIIRVWEIDQYANHPNMGKEHDEYPKSMYPRFDYSAKPTNDEKTNTDWKHKWGMAIDLNSCVGCNACVMACQAENNIPVVGKEQVERSREMHWLRVDAYFEGDDANNPDGPHFQPMLCQQCEQAPCEPVCPVHATVHSAEGLNDMVYNRCIGTRYCSNNCPYKVRRFNFLLYQDWNTPQYKLMRNPEVTVRSRGVMEKCTYCTQRIALARIEAQKDGMRRVRDGEVQTACQTVCPTNAIVFGDLNDETSAVNKIKNQGRDYKLLNELNTQPRTTYQANMKNPNKDMPGYKPRVVIEEHDSPVESRDKHQEGEQHGGQQSEDHGGQPNRENSERPESH
jgi:MoCo/4Fe-4S cofactor protein with predicted Tat translocation signal